jgi:hypothetical protein
MESVKPIAQLIRAQIQSLDDDEQASKEACEQASARRVKQKARLHEILKAVECEDLNITGKRIRALAEASKMEKRNEEP